mmetsp:Transcript_17883/g.25831  ORF Transcript_17883/g.25831 Transcript_17883/m.25831 type:complete len:944 (+) Transcript_17883:28-2859(+)
MAGQQAYESSSGGGLGGLGRRSSVMDAVATASRRGGDTLGNGDTGLGSRRMSMDPFGLAQRTSTPGEKAKDVSELLGKITDPDVTVFDAESMKNLLALLHEAKASPDVFRVLFKRPISVDPVIAFKTLTAVHLMMAEGPLEFIDMTLRQTKFFEWIENSWSADAVQANMDKHKFNFAFMNGEISKYANFLRLKAIFHYKAAYAFHGDWSRSEMLSEAGGDPVQGRERKILAGIADMMDLAEDVAGSVILGQDPCRNIKIVSFPVLVGEIIHGYEAACELVDSIENLHTRRKLVPAFNRCHNSARNVLMALNTAPDLSSKVSPEMAGMEIDENPPDIAAEPEPEPVVDLSYTEEVDEGEKKKDKKKKKKKKSKHPDEIQLTAASQGKPMAGSDGQVPEGFFAVGRIWVSQKVLGVGSNGTIVYEGKLQPGDRPIAVKRLLRYLYDSASKEIQMLISLDESTQNVVRYFAMEEDHEYIYLALELCAGTLAERVACKEHPALREKDIGDSIPGVTIAALNDLIQGIKNLHMFGVVHRDLKPQNVLLTRGNTKTTDVQVKLGDVGLATQLEGDRSSYSVMTGVGAVGTVGWRAPEVLRGDRQTKAVDIFSAGCVVHYVLTGGHHPFGDRPYERDLKIMKWEVDLSRLECFPEAHDLVSRMVVYDAGTRASADQIQHHPLFWTDSRKVAFLCDIADKLHDPRLGLMERINSEDEAEAFLDWQLKLDMTFLKNLNTRNMKTQRVYENNAAGLLRVIRNKRSHYSELDEDVQSILGAMPVEGVPDPRKNYYRYFSDRFPKLFMFVYRFARNTKGIYRDPQFACYNFRDTYMKATVEEQVEEIAELERRVSRTIGKGPLKGVSSKSRQKAETQPRVVRNFDEMISYGFERNHPKPSEKVLKKLAELRIYDPGVKARWRSMTKQVSNERQSAAQQKYAFPAHRIVLKQDRVN